MEDNSNIGMGRHIFTKQLILEELKKGSKIVIIDPKDEYKSLIEKLKENKSYNDKIFVTKLRIRNEN